MANYVATVLLVIYAGAVVAKLTSRPDVGAASPQIATEVGRPTVRVTLIGDEDTTGSTSNSEGHTWPALLTDSDRLRKQLLGVVGTGYTVGTESDLTDTMTSRVGLVDPEAKLVVFLGSRNDRVTTFETVYAEAAKAFADVHEVAPDAAIVVVGAVWGAEEAPPADLVRTQEAIGTAAVASGATWIDPIGERWFAGVTDAVDGEGTTHGPRSGGSRVPPVDSGRRCARPVSSACGLPPSEPSGE